MDPQGRKLLLINKFYHDVGPAGGVGRYLVQEEEDLGAHPTQELVAAALTIHSGSIHPTINYETPDDECDLDYVPNTAREKAISYAMSNSFGFGGNNCSLIFGRDTTCS